MDLAAFEAVAQALHVAQVRYLVAGGLAVNAHGYIRLTMDIDLVIALDDDNIRRAFHALADVGYRPSVQRRRLRASLAKGTLARRKRHGGAQLL